MTRSRFIARLLILIVSIALFQIASLELLVYHIMRPTLDEFIVMINAPGPIVAGLLGTFMVCTYFYIRPLTDFLKSVARSEAIDEEQVLLVHKRGLFFPYFMASFAFPFYMVGGALGNVVVISRLSWPSELIFYGFIGGIISSFMAAPMSIHGYHWIIGPVIRLSSESAPGLPPSRAAGFNLSIRRKLTLTIFSLAVALTGYTMLIGYSQNQLMHDHITSIEAGRTGEGGPPSDGPAMSAEDRLSYVVEYFEARVSGQAPVYIILFIIACGASLALAFLAAKEITGPVVMIREQADRVSRGRYDQPVRLISNDEFSELGMAFNRMLETIVGQIESMNSVVESLRSGIGRIDETVSTVAKICADQSSGATEQAAAVQQTSTTAEEIAATARHIEERAKSVDEVSASTLSACRDGEGKLESTYLGFKGISEHVDMISKAMSELEGRFLQTYGIVEMIEDIAEQSELLSLNAALEAAGAGEHGRRFGVVADSTRQLSAQSMEAAREIRELIEAIQVATVESIGVADEGKAKVAYGEKTIEETMEALRTISSLAETTSHSAGEITSATNQQTSASGQLAESISEVQKVALNFEAGAKEIEAAIRELLDFAEELRARVEKDKPER
jgi:methyl-accepting chemotaxis protein